MIGAVGGPASKKSISARDEVPLTSGSRATIRFLFAVCGREYSDLNDKRLGVLFGLVFRVCGGLLVSGLPRKDFADT